MMEPANLGTVSLRTVAAGGGADGPAVIRWAEPLDASEWMSPRLLVAIFCATIVVHLGLIARFGSAQRVRFVDRKASQVEIQITRPPPKPVVIPPQELHPPPPKPLTNKPQPRIVPPEPIHSAPIAAPDTPGLDAPAGDEGTSPLGTGAVEAPVEVAAPPPPPPPPAPVIEAKEGANYLKNPRPAYPHVAVREGWTGAIVLHVRVLPTGRAGDISVQKSSGHRVLDDAAVDAVKGWTFIPATQGGSPVAGWVNVPIEFQLK
jgi:periplasmic protein TonB